MCCSLYVAVNISINRKLFTFKFLIWLYLHDAGVFCSSETAIIELSPILWTALYLAPASFSIGVEKFDDQNAFLAVSGHFSLRMRRNAVISISCPKSVVFIVLDNIDLI